MTRIDKIRAAIAALRAMVAPLHFSLMLHGDAWPADLDLPPPGPELLACLSARKHSVIQSAAINSDGDCVIISRPASADEVTRLHDAPEAMCAYARSVSNVRVARGGSDS